MTSDPRRGAFARALRFCRRKRLFRRGDRVLVGTVGGAASLGALGFLVLARDELGIAEVVAASVDAGGADDPDAVADAGRFARQLGVNFHAVSSDGATATRALVALARREGYSRVALGHTRDDAVARALAQMLSGAGALGLRPLAARRRDGVVRPLLDVHEQEALELARTAGIEPVAMPPEPGARRSLAARLRPQVLPRLRVEAPGADDAILTLARDVRQLVRLAEAEAARRVEGASVGELGLEIHPAGKDGLLARAVADAALAKLGGPTAEPARAALARMLGTAQRAANYREVVLGPGLVATYVPARRVVAVRRIKGLAR